MFDQDQQSQDKFTELRRTAEKKLGEFLESRGQKLNEDDLSLEELIQEIQVHQVELEMQNEELRETQTRYQKAKQKYLNLYHSAPVSYLTLDEKGKILDANKTAAEELTTPRPMLTGKRLYEYIVKEDRDTLYKHLRAVFSSENRETCELKINPAPEEEENQFEVEEEGFYGLLASVNFENSEGETCSRTIISDITDKVLAEKETERKRKQIKKLSRRLINIQESERERISRDLHDELGQDLATINITLSTIKDELPLDSSPSIKDKFEELEDVIDRMDEQVREFALNLRSPFLDNDELASGLGSYLERLENTYDVEIKFEEETETNLSQDRQATLLRTAQEACRNAIRHGKPSRITVSLQEKNDHLELKIMDDGKGFQEEDILNDERSGIGLKSMKERVDIFDGEFRIHSTPGKGTEVYVKIPIDG